MAAAAAQHHGNNQQPHCRDHGSPDHTPRKASNEKPQDPVQLRAHKHKHKHKHPAVEPRFNFFWRYQAQAEKFYKSNLVEIGVATIIGANFLVNIVQSQIDPRENIHVPVWSAFELFFNVIFTLELLVNMYAFWFDRFWDKKSRSWNIFDIVVVSIGLLDTMQVPLPGELKLLRMMRAFRVFRLFKRIKSLNRIIVSLLHAVPGVINAFIINTLVMCIYAVLGVQFFRSMGGECSECESDSDCTHQNTDKEFFLCLADICTLAAVGRTNRTNVGNAMTGRNLCFGKEYFGTFFASLYTLFQVLSGDSWSEAVVRPILEYYTNFQQRAGAAFYFVSYILLNAVVLCNVVVAVLLEKMNDESVHAEESDSEEEEGVVDENGSKCAEAEDTSEVAPVLKDGWPLPPNQALPRIPAIGTFADILKTADACTDCVGALATTSQVGHLMSEVAAMREELTSLETHLGGIHEALERSVTRGGTIDVQQV